MLVIVLLVLLLSVTICDLSLMEYERSSLGLMLNFVDVMDI
jgi:hypothetical protein